MALELEKDYFRGEQSNFLYMDTKLSAKEASDNVTRESLIALSYPEPDKVTSQKFSPENVKGENMVERIDCDGDEKFRSELISISYSQSPDIKFLPVPHEEIRG